jgi:hypothetical protein
MTEIQPEPRQRPPVGETDRRHCPKCRTPMASAPYVPGLGHLAGRIFECSKCRYAEIAPE